MPVHDERHLFEMLTLEGAQAGLSWRTILYKREGYRHAFAGFDAVAVNARVVLGLADSGSTLDELVWSFVGGSPTINRWREPGEVPAETAASKAMSKELKRRGFRFVGPTVCYAFMQATGLVNDHVTACYRHREVLSLT